MSIDETTYSFQQNELSGNDQANAQKCAKIACKLNF